MYMTDWQAKRNEILLSRRLECVQWMLTENYKIQETGPEKGPLSAICLLYEKMEQHVSRRYRTHKQGYIPVHKNR